MRATRSPLPGSDADVLGRQIADLLDRVSELEQQVTAPRLHRSALHNTGLPVYDSNGQLRQTVGRTSDGTYGEEQFNGPPPPRPNTPDLQPIPAGIRAGWNGEFITARPNDFSHLLIYCSPAGPAFISGPSNLVGTVFRAGSYPVAPLPYAEHWVRYVAVNKSGQESEPSFTVSATPTRILGSDLFPATITETEIAPDSIETPHLKANAVTALKIAAESIEAGHLTAGAVTATKIAAELILTQLIEMYNPGGTRTLLLDGQTGNVSVMGEYRTSDTGERIVINPGNSLFKNTVRYVSPATAFTELVGTQDLVSGGPAFAIGGNSNSGLVDTARLLHRLDLVQLDWVRFSTGGQVPTFISVRPYQVSEESRIFYRFASQQYGSGDSLHLFGHRDTSGAEILSGRLEHRLKNNAEACLVAPGPGVGLLFGTDGATSGRVWVTATDLNTARSIAASDFTTFSSEEMKQNIGDLPISGKQIIRNARSRTWSFAPQPQHTRSLVQPDGTTEDVQVPAEQPVTHIGPMAEDLPEFLVEHVNNGKLVSLRDLIGIMWDALHDLIQEVDQARGQS